MKLAVVLLVLWISHVEGGCRYRDLDLPREIFSYWASWGCYIYTRPDFFEKEPLKATMCSMFIKDTAYRVPGIQLDLYCHPFHHENQHVVSEVDNSFWSNRSTTRWIDCTKEAEECCDNVMADEEPVVNRCPSVWDGWSCFQSIPSGQNYKNLCSRFAYGNEPPRCHHFSYKRCHHNGTWNHQTDYSPCDVTPPLIARNKYYIAILSISTIFCIPALVVLICTKAAQAQKLRIIRASLIVICIHNLMVILVRALIIIPELTTSRPTLTVMHQNSIACRCLTFFEKLTGNVVFSCMILIGIFLHQLLTHLFRIHDRNHSTEMFPFYVGAGFVAIGSVAGWTFFMAKYYDHNCWQVSDDGHVDWILDGPRLAMLCVNLILLLHVTVKLWQTFNAKESDQSPFLRTLKAALICSPVFGMQFLFLIVHPDMDNCGTEQLYYVVNYTISGAQGIFIAIFHCYTEREVSKYLVAWYKRIKSFCSRSPIIRSNRRRTVTGHELVNHTRASQGSQAPVISRPRSESFCG